MKVTKLTKSELADRRLNGKAQEPYNYTKKEVKSKSFVELLFEILTGGKDA